MLVHGPRLASALIRAEEGGFFAEVVGGSLRITGRGWRAECPLRSWAPDQVLGAYSAPQATRPFTDFGLGVLDPGVSSVEGSYLDLTVGVYGELHVGTRTCRPLTDGVFWVAAFWEKIGG